MQISDLKIYLDNQKFYENLDISNSIFELSLSELRSCDSCESYDSFEPVESVIPASSKDLLNALYPLFNCQDYPSLLNNKIISHYYGLNKNYSLFILYEEKNQEHPLSVILVNHKDKSVVYYHQNFNHIITSSKELDSKGIILLSEALCSYVVDNKELVFIEWGEYFAYLCCSEIEIGRKIKQIFLRGYCDNFVLIDKKDARELYCFIVNKVCVWQYEVGI